jgi:hypothetical protein
MIGQPKSSFNIREMMDKRKIMIINLSKGRIGETNANLLGGMLITKIYLAALSRADVPDRVLKGLPNFYLFVDEFQSFANESFADILSEARKYKLNLTMAHQYIEQMEEEVRAAVFGNVGTMIVFRVGSYDAEVLEKEFAPEFTAEDIVNLGFAQIYLKLMIDGISSHPFSATTLPPIAQPEISNANKVIEESRKQFAKDRLIVEKDISDWHAPIAPSHKPKAKMDMKEEQKIDQKIEQKPEYKPEHKTENRIENKIENKENRSEQRSDIKPIKNPYPNTNTNSNTNHNPVTVNQNNTQNKNINNNTNQSLHNILQTPHPHISNNTKEASPEKVNELRNALASVLGKNIPRQSSENIKDNKEKTIKVEKDIEKSKLSSHDKDSNKSHHIRNDINEISEEKLREVLKTD